MPTVFSCVASRNKRVARLRWARWSYPICILNASLRFAEPPGPDASPSGGPQTHYVCCVPPRRPTHLKAQHPFTAQKYRIRSQPNICSPPAVSATSSEELQSAAWGGGGLRGSKSRRSNIPFTAPFCEVRPRARPPAPAYGVRCAPRTAIPLGTALLVLSSSGRSLSCLG